jgi:ABC-type nitrate/sulfonate/bicarbonate transport system permease component
MPPTITSEASLDESAAMGTAVPQRRVGTYRTSKRYLVGTLSLAAAIGVYWFVATRPGVTAALVPAPPTIARTLVEQLGNGELWTNTVASLKRVLIGFAAGASLAVVIGSIAGWFRMGGYILNPLIDALRPIPALAYIPLVIVWVGIGEPSRIIIIALAVFKPCVVNARAGMNEIAQIYVDAARTLGAGTFRVFMTIALPSAVPYIIAGMRTGLSTGFLALVAAELIAASSGLGFMIESAGQYFRTDIVIVGIIAIGVVGALLDQFARIIGARLTRWSETRR